MDNYYELIGVNKDADVEIIKKAIKDTRKRYRHMTNSPVAEKRQAAEAAMSKLDAAYDILLDSAKRANYDRELAAAPVAPVAAAGQMPNTTDWLERTKAYTANGDPRNAHQAAKQATLVAPDNSETWLYRAMAALDLGDTTDADFSAHEGQVRDTGNPFWHALIGDVRSAERRYAEAKAAYEIAYAQEPTNTYYALSIADCLSSLGAWSELKDFTYKLYTENPNSPEITDYYADALLQCIQYEIAYSDPETNMYWLTSPEAIDAAEQCVNTMASLNVSDKNRDFYTQVVAENRDLIEKSRKRTFIGIPAIASMGGAGYVLAAALFLGPLLPFFTAGVASSGHAGAGISAFMFIMSALTYALMFFPLRNLFFPHSYAYNQRYIVEASTYQYPGIFDIIKMMIGKNNLA